MLKLMQLDEWKQLHVAPAATAAVKGQKVVAIAQLADMLRWNMENI